MVWLGSPMIAGVAIGEPPRVFYGVATVRPANHPFGNLRSRLRAAVKVRQRVRCERGGSAGDGGGGQHVRPG